MGKLCECGCGQEVVLNTARFLRGHNVLTTKFMELDRLLNLSEGNPMFGKHPRPETIERMKKTHQGLIQTEVSNEKRRQWNLQPEVLVVNRKRFLGDKNPMRDPEIARKLSGENCPFYVDGLSSYEPYPPEFNIKLKLYILKRDDYTCQLCTSGIDLMPHHIDYVKEHCDPSNLITLCRSCNSKVNTDREYWIIFFQQVMVGRNLCVH